MDDASRSQLLDMCGDWSLGLADNAGNVSPANAAMRNVLDRLRAGSEPVPLSDWPVASDDCAVLRQLLSSGEGDLDRTMELRAGRGTRRCRVRLQRASPAARWCVAIAEVGPTAPSPDVRLRRLERLRLLARLATGIVHDLNNVLGGVLGLAEQVSALPIPAEDRHFLDVLGRAAQDGSVLLTGLEQMTASAEVRERVPLGRVVRETLAMFVKSAAKDGIGVVVDVASDLPAVRVVRPDLMHALIGVLIILREGLAAGNPIRVDAYRASAGSGRPRGIIRARAAGDPAGVEPLQQLLDEGFPGVLAPLSRLRGDAFGLALALASLHAGGAEVDCDTSGPEREVRLALPGDYDTGDAVTAS